MGGDDEDECADDPGHNERDRCEEQDFGEIDSSDSDNQSDGYTQAHPFLPHLVRPALVVPGSGQAIENRVANNGEQLVELVFQLIERDDVPALGEDSAEDRLLV